MCMHRLGTRSPPSSEHTWEEAVGFLQSMLGPARYALRAHQLLQPQHLRTRTRNCTCKPPAPRGPSRACVRACVHADHLGAAVREQRAPPGQHHRLRAVRRLLRGEWLVEGVGCWGAGPREPGPRARRWGMQQRQQPGSHKARLACPIARPPPFFPAPPAHDCCRGTAAHAATTPCMCAALTSMALPRRPRWAGAAGGLVP